MMLIHWVVVHRVAPEFLATVLQYCWAVGVECPLVTICRVVGMPENGRVESRGVVRAFTARRLEGYARG